MESYVQNYFCTWCNVDERHRLPRPALHGRAHSAVNVVNFAHGREDDGRDRGPGPGRAELVGVDRQAEVQGHDVAEGQTLGKWNIHDDRSINKLV